MPHVKLNRVVSEEGYNIALHIVNTYAGLLSPKGPDGTQYYSVFSDDEGCAVGVVGYRALTKYTVEQVNTVILPEYRGRGYGSAASEAMEKTLFVKGYNKVFCTVNVKNTPMILIKLRRGFKVEGTLLSHYAPNRDIVLFGKLRSNSNSEG